MEAINNFSESIKSQNDTLSKLSQTYSDCTKKSLSASEPRVIFRELLWEIKYEELIQERERESRAKTIIIHGFPEIILIRKRKKRITLNSSMDYWIRFNWKDYTSRPT